MARQRRPLRDFERHMQLDAAEMTLDAARTLFEAEGAGHVHELAGSLSSGLRDATTIAPIRAEDFESSEDSEDSEDSAMLATDLEHALTSIYDHGYRQVEAELEAQRETGGKTGSNGGLFPHAASGNAPRPVQLNWVEQVGGLPGAKGGKFHRLIDHLKAGGMTEQHAIATTVNQARKYCAQGHEDWCADAASWEAKKAASHAKHTTLAAENGHGSLAQRGHLAAVAVVHAVWQAITNGRINGHNGHATQTAGVKAGIAALHAQAQQHAGYAMSNGRVAAADNHASQIAGVRYTSILDGHRCSVCREADDDVLRALDDPIRLANKPPNPRCLGGGRCRCLEFYVLSSEAPAFA